MHIKYSIYWLAVTQLCWQSISYFEYLYEEKLISALSLFKTNLGLNLRQFIFEENDRQIGLIDKARNREEQ